MLWLEENDDQSLEYMYNAIDKDKKEGVDIFSIKSFFDYLNWLFQKLSAPKS